jgi:hypothetical protein
MKHMQKNYANHKLGKMGICWYKIILGLPFAKHSKTLKYGEKDVWDNTDCFRCCRVNWCCGKLYKFIWRGA